MQVYHFPQKWKFAFGFDSCKSRKEYLQSLAPLYKSLVLIKFKKYIICLPLFYSWYKRIMPYHISYDHTLMPLISVRQSLVSISTWKNVTLTHWHTYLHFIAAFPVLKFLLYPLSSRWFYNKIEIISNNEISREHLEHF